MRYTHFALLTAVLLACACPGTVAADEGGTDPTSIKFTADTSLSEFLGEAANATNTTILFDPNSQRIRSQRMGSNIDLKVPAGRLLDTYRALLSFYELTLIPVGPSGAGILLAIDSRSSNNMIKNKAKFVAPEEVQSYADRDGMYIATIFPLQHIQNFTVLRTALSTMVSPAGIGRVHEIPGVGIVVMDFAPTVAGMQNLLRRADVPGDNTMEMASIELARSKAEEVAAAVQSMFPASAPQAPRRGFSSTSGTRPVVTPFAHRNSIIVRATRKQMAEIRALVVTLDDRAVKEKAMKVMEIVYLKTAQARDVANAIAAVIRGDKTSPRTVTAISYGPKNAIVVRGSETEVKLVLALIKRLDTATPAK